MEDLIAAVNEAIEELEGRYDGAPDSPYLWMGSLICDLRTAVQKAERVLHNWQLRDEERRGA